MMAVMSALRWAVSTAERKVVKTVCWKDRSRVERSVVSKVEWWVAR